MQNNNSNNNEDKPKFEFENVPQITVCDSGDEGQTEPENIDIFEMEKNQLKVGRQILIHFAISTISTITHFFMEFINIAKVSHVTCE